MEVSEARKDLEGENRKLKKLATPQRRACRLVGLQPKTYRYAACRSDLMPLDSELLLPGQDDVRCELGAIVADDHARAASAFDDVVEFTRHMQAVSEVSAIRPRH